MYRRGSGSKLVMFLEKVLLNALSLRPTSVESELRPMELAVAPEFTICPTGQFTIEQLIKVDRVERER